MKHLHKRLLTADAALTLPPEVDQMQIETDPASCLLNFNTDSEVRKSRLEAALKGWVKGASDMSFSTLSSSNENSWQLRLWIFLLLVFQCWVHHLHIEMAAEIQTMFYLKPELEKKIIHIWQHGEIPLDVHERFDCIWLNWPFTNFGKR